MPIKCRIWWDTQLNSYIFTCSYSEKFIDAVKKFIPSGARDYNDQTKQWFFQEQYGEFVRQVAESAFGVGSVSFTSKNVASQSQQQSYARPSSAPYTQSPLVAQPQTTEDCLIAFMNLVPYEAAKKCYLTATQTLHPDKPTGDAQKMSRLNQLWERIEKEFYKR